MLPAASRRDDVQEEVPWWEWSENIVFVAEHLVRSNVIGSTILDLFQRPWEFTREYAAALAAGVAELCDDRRHGASDRRSPPS